MTMAILKDLFLKLSILLALIIGCHKTQHFEVNRTARILQAMQTFLFFEGVKTLPSRSGEGLGEKLSWRIASFPGFGKMMLCQPAMTEWQDLKSTPMDGIGEFYTNPQTGSCEIFAVIGPGTIFDVANRHLIENQEIPPSTLLIVELKHAALHWMAPVDLDILDLIQQKELTDLCVDQQSLWVVFADGLVVNFEGKISGEDLGSLAIQGTTSLQLRKNLIERFGTRSILNN